MLYFYQMDISTFVAHSRSISVISVCVFPKFDPCNGLCGKTPRLSAVPMLQLGYFLPVYRSRPGPEAQAQIRLHLYSGIRGGPMRGRQPYSRIKKVYYTTEEPDIYDGKGAKARRRINHRYHQQSLAECLSGPTTHDLHAHASGALNSALR
jgi:hypothetical protein